MSARLVQYLGYFHTLKDSVHESWAQFWTTNGSNGQQQQQSQDELNLRSRVRQQLDSIRSQTIQKIDGWTGRSDQDFSHVYRRKTRLELLKISAAVMGIEFSYAAETAFVSPLLLNLGLRHRQLTLMWFLSPLLGFFITPLLGSLSDGCRSKLGRRRPFIILLSIGILAGLLLVPNGKQIGIWCGDKPIIAATAAVTPPPQLLYSGGHDFNQTVWNRTTNTGLETNHSHSSLSFGTSMTAAASATGNRKDIHGHDITITGSSPRGSGSGLFKLKRVPPEELDPNLHALAATNHSPVNETRASGGAEGAFNRVPSQWRDAYYKYQLDPEEEGKTSQRKRHTRNRRRRRRKADARADAPHVNVDRVLELFHEIDTEWKHLFQHEDGPWKVPRDPLEAQNGRLGNLSAEILQAHGDGGERGPTPDETEWSNTWGVFFTVLGTVLLDFDADACQSPSRAFMLDVTVPEDQARGLSTFTIMAGLGGAVGYFLGALDWEQTFVGNIFGDQVHAVFTLILFIFIACVITTVTSFPEIPLEVLGATRLIRTVSSGTSGRASMASLGCVGQPKRIQSTKSKMRYSRFRDESCSGDEDDSPTFSPDGGTTITDMATQETSFTQNDFTRFEEMETHDPRRASSTASVTLAGTGATAELPTFKDYVKTIIRMPVSLKWLCVTNFFSWLSLVCYSLYFTDFVGEAVFGGNPNHPSGTEGRRLYADGIRFGCFGMSFYSMSCSIYSCVIEKFVERFGAKRVYIYGHVVYSIGMVFMALSCNRTGVILFSWTAGIMYATLFTMPYLLVARYHAVAIFERTAATIGNTDSGITRGLGTDVAIVSSMVFLAQMTQSLILGTIVTLVGSTVAVVYAAAIFASCGALAATRILYLDL